MRRVTDHPRLLIFLAALALALIVALASCDGKPTPTPDAYPGPGVASSALLSQAEEGGYACEYIPTDTGFNLACDRIGEPEPTATLAASATATPRVRGTATATAELPTAEPTGVVTPTATVEATGTPPSQTEHDVTMWHAPGEGGGTVAEQAHHHGHNPADTIFADYIAENWDNHFGYPWHTSPAENAWPVGKHDGFHVLYEEDTNCDLGNQPPGPCIKSYLLIVHSIGTGHAVRTRFHSERLLALVCQEGGAEPCDIVETGGHADYGTFHSLYKQTICTADPANPPLPDNLVIDQQPYRTTNGSARTTFFWAANVNAIVEPYYNPIPNNIIDISWNELGVWSSPARANPECADPAHDTVFASANGTKHQVFSIQLHLDQFPERPFSGFTDVHGNRVEGMDCIAASAHCVPIFIGENVPQNATPILSRIPRHGDPDFAPIQDFDDGTPLLMNQYGVDGH